jgi:hypothetical protein
MERILAGQLAILDQDVEALLDQQRRVEDNQAEAQREHVVARAHLEERANRSLLGRQPALHRGYVSCRTRPSSCSRSTAVRALGGITGRPCSR